jgi:heat shock protein HslJ
MNTTRIPALMGVLLAAAVLLLTAACTPTAAPAPTEPTPPPTETPAATPTVEPAPAADLVGTEWVLVRYGPQGNLAKPLPENLPTLSFQQDSLGGNTGCNQFGGEYEVAGNRIEISDIFQTLIACDEPIMEQERDYLEALRAAKTYTLAEENLTLVYEGGELHFTPQQPEADEALERTEWQLTTFVEGEAARSLLADTEITATFEGGAVNGNAGCNEYHAAYVLSGYQITVGDTAATRMHCGEAIMEQEEAFLSSLRSARTYEIDGRRLILHHAGGSLIFSTR